MGEKELKNIFSRFHGLPIPCKLFFSPIEILTSVYTLTWGINPTVTRFARANQELDTAP